MLFWTQFCPSAPSVAPQPTRHLFLRTGKICLGADSLATRNTAKDSVPPLPIPRHLCCLSKSAHFLSVLTELRDPLTSIYSNPQDIHGLSVSMEHVDHRVNGDFRHKDRGRNIPKAEEVSHLTRGYMATTVHAFSVIFYTH